jgi:hypothetical protein
MISGQAVPFDLDDPADQHQTYPVALSFQTGATGSSTGRTHFSSTGVT